MHTWKREKIGNKLLAFVKSAETQAAKIQASSEENSLVRKFQNIEAEVKSWIPTIKNWETKLVERLRELEERIIPDDDKYIRPEVILKNLEIINQGVESIKELFGQSKKSSDHLKGKQIISDDHDDNGDQQQHRKKDRQLDSKMYLKFQKCYDSLESQELKACYLCLSIFPVNSIIKKKPLIYWWIAEGFISKTNGRTAEEVGEEVFEELIDEGFLIPKPDHPSPSVNSCTVHPLARRTLMFLSKSVHFFDFDSKWENPVNGYFRAFLFSGNSQGFSSYTIDQEVTLGEYLTVFNLTEQYLQLGDWLSKLNSIRVLQLGRWQNNVKHHIEVENQDSTFNPEMKRNEEDVYLNGLGTQDSLRYLSLRGVSRMTSLPSVVAKLSSLEILDLRDCQGLQKLDFDISLLQNLTHLDVSECYLLESMPKGIEKLSSLQVLKGFIMNSKKDPCKVRDLPRLKQLRKLSIRIGKEAKEEGDFENFKDFKALQILVISWSGADVLLESLTVPPHLKKLELKCTPISDPPKWLSPDQLKSLEKLYIRGGKLNTLTLHGTNENQWRVKILILKYLKQFKVGFEERINMFRELEYLENVGCRDWEDGLWRKETRKMICGEKKI